MKAGALRHRVTFQRKVVDQDSNGLTVEGWVDAFTVPASITPLSGRELIAAQAVNSEVTGRIGVRRRADFDATMRALHRGTIYNLLAVIPDADSGFRHITLLTSTGVNAG